MCSEPQRQHSTSSALQLLSQCFPWLPGVQLGWWLVAQGVDFCIFSILFKISPGPLPLRWLCRQMPISTDAGDVARVFPPAERKNEENEMQRQFHQFPSNFPKDRMNFDDGKIGWCANFLTSEKYRTCRTCRSCNWLNLQSVCEWPHPIWSESSKDSRMCVSTTRQRCSKS